MPGPRSKTRELGLASITSLGPGRPWSLAQTQTHGCSDSEAQTRSLGCADSVARMVSRSEAHSDSVVQVHRLGSSDDHSKSVVRMLVLQDARSIAQRHGYSGPGSDAQSLRLGDSDGHAVHAQIRTRRPIRSDSDTGTQTRRLGCSDSVARRLRIGHSDDQTRSLGWSYSHSEARRLGCSDLEAQTGGSDSVARILRHGGLVGWSCSDSDGGSEAQILRLGGSDAQTRRLGWSCPKLDAQVLGLSRSDGHPLRLGHSST